jgi:hypothetical protein
MPLSLSGTTGIVTGNIAPLNITTATIASDAVTTVKILNENVTGAKIQQRAKFPNYASGSARAYNTVHQAAEDGYLNVVVQGAFRNGIQIVVGQTSSPTLIIWQAGDDINNNTKANAAMLPIPKNTYYKVEPFLTDGFEVITITWFPAIL